jgi:formylglycine-generating enzyme required for sulfatase activity
VIEAYEVRQQLSVLGAPLFRNGTTNLLKVEAEGFKVLQRSLNLHNLDFDLELEDSLPESKPEQLSSKDLMIQLLTPKGKPLSTDFEVLLGGKTIFAGTAKDQGRFPIPEPLKAQIQKEGLLIKARGFADSPGHGTKLLSGQSSLSLVYHPEVQKILDDMVYIEGGTFYMGCTQQNPGECSEDEAPVHPVTLSTFSIGRFEVTQAQWVAIMGSNPSNFNTCPNCPVEQVNWYDCQNFITKLSTITGERYGLPTEAQWEYAARGGPKQERFKYAGGDSSNDVAWHNGNSNSESHPVGGKSKNAGGLFDMSGNVWEWCSDWANGKYYKNSPQKNPKGPDNGSSRVLRGGSWISNSEVCRVSSRFSYAPGNRNINIGFRVTRD